MGEGPAGVWPPERLASRPVRRCPSLRNHSKKKKQLGSSSRYLEGVGLVACEGHTKITRNGAKTPGWSRRGGLWSESDEQRERGSSRGGWSHGASKSGRIDGQDGILRAKRIAPRSMSMAQLTRPEEAPDSAPTATLVVAMGRLSARPSPAMFLLNPWKLQNVSKWARTKSGVVAAELASNLEPQNRIGAWPDWA